MKIDRIWLRRRFALAATPAAATILAFAATARGDVIVYEPFDYSVGNIAGTTAGGVNLSGEYSTVEFPTLEARVETPGVNYGNLIGAPTAAGNRLSQNTGTTATIATVNVD